MRRHKGEIIFSASDLVAFLGCRHAVALNRRHLDDPLEEAADDPELALLQERGLAHEANYRDTLRKTHGGLVDIPEKTSLAERVRQTHEHMKAGAPVIYQGVLTEGAWHGYADFLVRTNEQSSVFGSWAYQVEDTKLARAASPKHAIQLAVYSDLLTSLQGVQPQQMAVVLGNGEREIIRTRDIHAYYAHAKARFEAFVAEGTPGTVAEPCAQCSMCRWRDRCEQEWEDNDHLSLVANIRRNHIEALREAGVDTLAALAALKPDVRIPGMQQASLEKVRAQAALQLQYRLTGKPVTEILPDQPGRGFARLPKPDRGDLFFDMEGDPHHPDGLEYLFGFVSGNDAGAFTTFWAHDHREEKQAIADVLDFVAAHLKKHPKAHVYHYAHYEPSALKRLAARYGIREGVLDDLLRGHKLVDLLRVVREGIRTSEPSASLKNLERFYGVTRQEDVANAGQSIVVYETWRRSKDPVLLQQIADYNEVDCRSTAGLRDWLLTMKPKAIAWFDSASLAPDDERLARQTEAEVEQQALEARVLKGARAHEREYRQLVADLTGYHRREMKPQFWALFDRQNWDEEDLIEDLESLGGLVLDGAPVPEKRSNVYTYRFPPQETKLREGSQPTIAATTQRAGEIVAMDETKGFVRIKRGNASGELPARLSLGPQRPIETDTLKQAVHRFAVSVAKREGKFLAVEHLLRREAPALSRRTPGQPIIRPGKDLIEETIKAVKALDRSHLFIQGPPGTGKTYTASRIIVELMRSGKRVGVSSNSHKAINNLLEAVVTRAKEQKFRFSGIKKASAQDPASRFDGPMIENDDKLAELPRDCQLVAGTAWLFARETFEQQLDYLFIDEAGQVCLANVVAMGTAARNVILIGDQMQLPQPIQGVHPRNSGVSVLEHLLEGAATVPPDRGVFLGISRRMHPAICCFISEAIYDGRLGALSGNEKQVLVLKDDCAKDLRPSGLQFVPVVHEGRSQSCPEEAERVKALWNSLLKQSWRSADSRARSITPDDILVVAPYNAQVNLLQRTLPAGARIGTVDKFQGQEAAVVIISMTSSSGDDMPRGIEFLLSRNRMNVAISRAKSLALLLASPALLEVHCNTIEQMRLASVVCAAISE